MRGLGHYTLVRMGKKYPGSSINVCLTRQNRTYGILLYSAPQCAFRFLMRSTTMLMLENYFPERSIDIWPSPASFALTSEGHCNICEEASTRVRTYPQMFRGLHKTHL